jgi:hypothetical protein
MAGGRAVLFVAHDVPLPPPLDALRHTTEPFAVALVLVPGAGRHGVLRITPRAGAVAPGAMPSDLRALHDSNPVARALPLLAALAVGAPAALDLPMLEDARLALEVAP